MTGDTGDLGKGQLREEAAVWFSRMRGPDAEARRAEFEQWLARGALHRAAYNRIAARFAEGRHLREYIRTRRAQRLATIGIGAAFLAIIVPLTLGVVTKGGGSNTGASARTTQIVRAGKVRRFALPDGSSIVLDRNASVGVRFDEYRRSVELLSGRVRFEVRRNKRPFAVFAADVRIVARGTVFDVGIERGEVIAIALFRGRVDVARRSSHGRVMFGKPVLLREGQTIRLDRNRTSGPTPLGPSVANWTSARIEFDRARLVDVVARANRNSTVQILVPEGTVGDLRVSGVFPIDDRVLLAERLATLFDLEVDRRTPDTLILRSRAK